MMWRQHQQGRKHLMYHYYTGTSIGTN
jgi:hypothetical protein